MSGGGAAVIANYFSAFSHGLWIILVPLIVPVLLLCEFADPPTTAGLGLRWRTLLNDGAVGRTILRVRTAPAILTVSFRMNPLLAAPPDLSEPG
jgi:hypothetical protein